MFVSLINSREFFEPLFCVGNCSGHWGGESSERTVVPVLIKLHSRVSSHILVGSRSSLMCGILPAPTVHFLWGLPRVRMPTFEEQCSQERYWQAMGTGRTFLLSFKNCSAKYGRGSSKAARQWESNSLLLFTTLGRTRTLIPWSLTVSMLCFYWLWGSGCSKGTSGPNRLEQ